MSSLLREVRVREFKLCESQMTSMCRELFEVFQKGDIVLLRGDLGSGKTTFVRELLCCENPLLAKQVSSPTFSLAQSYESAKFGMVHHYDLYRKSLQEMLELGLLDMLSEDGVHFVEWGDENLERILRGCGMRVACVEIMQMLDTSDTQCRIYTIDI